MILFKFIIICYVLSSMSEFIGDILLEIEIKSKWLNIFRYFITYILSCNKCFSFWFTLIATGNLFLAAGVGIIIGFINKITEKYFNEW